MAALMAAAPDKVEILALVDTALSWDLDGADLPSAEDALSMAACFTRYGRIAAADLRAQCLANAGSDAADGAQATLSEADRRLNLKPLARTAAPRSAARRAQNLARLVQALNRATGAVSEKRVPSCRHSPPCPTAEAPDREAAHVIAHGGVQGWSLLCNQVLLFEDTGELLPSGKIIAPRRPVGAMGAGA